MPLFETNLRQISAQFRQMLAESVQECILNITFLVARALLRLKIGVGRRASTASRLPRPPRPPPRPSAEAAEASRPPRLRQNSGERVRPFLWYTEAQVTTMGQSQTRDRARAFLTSQQLRARQIATPLTPPHLTTTMVEKDGYWVPKNCIDLIDNTGGPAGET